MTWHPGYAQVQDLCGIGTYTTTERQSRTTNKQRADRKSAHYGNGAHNSSNPTREQRRKWTWKKFVERVKSNHLVEVVGGGRQPSQIRQRWDEGVHASLRREVDAARALLSNSAQRGGLRLVLQGVDNNSGHPLCPLDRARILHQPVADRSRAAAVACLQAQHRMLRAVECVQKDAKKCQVETTNALVQLHAQVAPLNGITNSQVQRPLQYAPAAAFGLLLRPRLLAALHVRRIINSALLQHAHHAIDDAKSYRVQVVG